MADGKCYDNLFVYVSLSSQSQRNWRCKVLLSDRGCLACSIEKKNIEESFSKSVSEDTQSSCHSSDPSLKPILDTGF